MKTIGLIGGMSWESTVPYYRIINETVKETLGGLHSAKCLLYSVDFFELEACLATEQWDKITRILGQAAQTLEKAGADLIVICTNTMHKVAPEIQQHIHSPIIHIADVTAQALLQSGIKKAGLLGTKFTMTQAFYKDRLTAQGLEVVIPPAEDVELINRVIFEELCVGITSEQSRADYLRIIQALSQQGAEGIILGCTEIGLLISQSDTPIALFDTTLIHAKSAAELALDD
ncbi:MAG TPA: aspartate/glutamate racemase family protein [Clostridia bacterium]|nr:aspartate/glutamate racemase family protein [Clostridia bacterium]